MQPTLKTEGFDDYGNPGTNVYGDLIVSSTGLESLNCFKFGTFSRAGDVRIKNTNDLKSVNLTSLVYGLHLEITNNHQDAQILLGGLTSASSLMVMDAASVDISKLATTDGNFNITRNNFEEFAAPVLTQIGGDFIVVENDHLNDLNLPLLRTIGGSYVEGDFMIANNPALPYLALSNLTYVDGNTTITGNFSR